MSLRGLVHYGRATSSNVTLGEAKGLAYPNTGIRCFTMFSMTIGVSSCPDSYRDVEGWCERLYTPWFDKLTMTA